MDAEQGRQVLVENMSLSTPVRYSMKRGNYYKLNCALGGKCKKITQKFSYHNSDEEETLFVTKETLVPSEVSHEEPAVLNGLHVSFIIMQYIWYFQVPWIHA